MSDDKPQIAPPVSPLVVCLGLFGAVIGGGIGFWIRGSLNEREVIGFGNIPDQLLKLLVWTGVGAVLGAAGGTVIGWAINQCRRA